MRRPPRRLDFPISTTLAVGHLLWVGRLNGNLSSRSMASQTKGIIRVDSCNHSSPSRQVICRTGWVKARRSSNLDILHRKQHLLISQIRRMFQLYIILGFSSILLRARVSFL